MKEANPKRAVVIVEDPETIRLLADVTRAEILRLLGERAMTETQLAEELGLTKAAVGYHLHLLAKAGLISISKVEAEEHGILQKYYTVTAAMFIVDPDRMPEDTKRYFLRAQIEHLRGMLAVFKFYDKISEISSEIIEKLAKEMLKQLKIVGQRYVDSETSEDVGLLKVEIYAEALAAIIKQRKWCKLFTS